MKLLQYKRNGQILLGIRTPRGVVDAAATAEKLGKDWPVTMEQMMARGTGEWQRWLNAPEQVAAQAVWVPEPELIYAPCIHQPQKILCAGLNYAEHVEECKELQTQVPEVFGIFANALAAHEQAIALTPIMQQVDYEVELVAVIGKPCRQVTPEQAEEHIFGFTVGNDLSERRAQQMGSQWLMGKGLDGFAPIGPHIVTADELTPERAKHLQVCTRVNGVVRQQDTTAHMLRTPGEIISFISQHMTLLPGDLVFTGTPGGVMMGKPPEQQVWLKPGDVVEVEIEGIGVLRNRFVAAE